MLAKGFRQIFSKAGVRHCGVRAPLAGGAEEIQIPRKNRGRPSRARAARRHQKKLLEQPGLPCEARLRHALVVADLLKELQPAEYDLIASGCCPAKDKLRQYVLGDVWREIVHRAGLGVLVVRTGTKRAMRRVADFLNRLFRPGE